MNSTPQANRRKIVIVGHTNTGKSTLFNRLIGYNLAIVADHKGTTTDPVRKAVELLSVGPVLFVDTPGIGDNSPIEKARTERAKEEELSADLILRIYRAPSLLADPIQLSSDPKTLHIGTFADQIEDADRNELHRRHPDLILLAIDQDEPLDQLHKAIVHHLIQLPEEKTLVGDLVAPGETILLVIPIDSEAPKGRLILPQVQLMRDALDHRINLLCIRETELNQVLQMNYPIRLVVCDSQIFREVDSQIKGTLPLTGFSLLFARQKGDFGRFVKGAHALRSLPPGARILIAESCSHTTSHDDIGRHKLPSLLRRQLGDQIEIDFRQGVRFDQIDRSYDLIIHCGACMISRHTMISRLDRIGSIPTTNYGMAIAELTGILDRALQPFSKVKY